MISEKNIISLFFALTYSLCCSVCFSQKQSPPIKNPSIEQVNQKKTNPQQEKKEVKASFKYLLGASYNIYSAVNYSSIQFSSLPVTSSALINYSKNLVLDVMIIYSDLKSWGSHLGLNYALPRKITGGLASLGGSSSSSSVEASDSQLQTTSLYIGTNYMIEKVFLNFSLNYTLVNLTSGPGILETGSPQTTNGFGFNTSAGYFITDHWLLDFSYWYQSFKTKYVGESGDTADYGTGLISTISFGAKYLF